MRVAGRRDLPAQCRCQSRSRSLWSRETRASLRGGAREPGERLTREMQKAAEERPLIGERKGPYAIGESSSEAVREAPPSALIHHAFLSLDCARPGGDPDRQSLR
jgi:hypothetical protein